MAVYTITSWLTGWPSNCRAGNILILFGTMSGLHPFFENEYWYDFQGGMLDGDDTNK